MPPEASGVQARAWLRKARADLRNAEIVLHAEDGPLDTVAFHAQQVAEKALKSVLTASARPFPRLHDLEALAALLPGEARGALPIDPETLALLSQFAVASRYPGWDDADFDRETVEAAVAAARAILVAAETWLDAREAPPARAGASPGPANPAASSHQPADTATRVADPDGDESISPPPARGKDGAGD